MTPWSWGVTAHVSGDASMPAAAVNHLHGSDWRRTTTFPPGTYRTCPILAGGEAVRFPIPVDWRLEVPDGGKVTLRLGSLGRQSLDVIDTGRAR